MYSTSTTATATILADYQRLLGRIDTWFAAAALRHPEQIRCGKGCSGCCRGLFDITILDGALLQQGFAQLPPTVRGEVLEKATARLARMQQLWPELAPPYLLNHRPDEEWEQLMPDDDETPCVLLDDHGHCLVYDHRPMTCRLHGLPLVDISGEVMHDEWCTENFMDTDPLALTDLAAPFDEIFRQEVMLGREFSRALLGDAVHELDTFIPPALLVDYAEFPWGKWWNSEYTPRRSHARSTD
jgi:Fe-S-cluster containining protein